MKTVVGRFAPTPSGKMHLGNVLCCLIAWLSARSQGGRVILRVEDLDPERSGAEYERQIEDDLRWLGLTWDEGGLEAADGAYCQSARSGVYQKYFDILSEKGLIYPCFCSRAELHAASAPHLSDGRYLYPGACRDLAPEEAAERAKRRRPAWRVKTPDETVRFTDLRYGPYAENLAAECGDFVVRRADGVFAYQLATAVDDGLMGVTEVVRGRDLLGSTARQIWLQRTLGLPSPVYGHIPLLTDWDGRRLSKRDGDLDLARLRERFAPEEIIGMLAEAAGLLPAYRPVSAEDMIPLFSWGKVKKGDVRLPGELGMKNEN